MSDAPKVLVSCEGGIARVDINRPEVRNAFDGETIALLIETFQSLAEDPEARVIVLGGRGKSFCAGADLKWMMSMAAKNALANSSDANVLASFFDVVNACPKPVIGRVHGAVRGGGRIQGSTSRLLVDERTAVPQVGEHVAARDPLAAARVRR